MHCSSLIVWLSVNWLMPITLHCTPGTKQMRAVATLLADSTSAIVTLASSGIDRPSQLDGKVYASYGARYEGRIVQQLIRNDGGKGDFTESTPAMLGIWNTLLKASAAARGRGAGRA